MKRGQPRGGYRARAAIAAWALTCLAGCAAFQRPESDIAAPEVLPPLPGSPTGTPPPDRALVTPGVVRTSFDEPAPAQAPAPPVTLAPTGVVPAPPAPGPFLAAPPAADGPPAPPPPGPAAGPVPQVLPLTEAPAPAAPAGPTITAVPPPSEDELNSLPPGPGGLIKAGCPTCGGSGISGGSGGYSSCSSCGGSGCVPGRKPGQAFEANTFVGRAFGNLYEALCCPDPCYEPSWIPEANAAFTLDYARPRTLMRLRYDHVENFLFPDRNEFFWARENIGNGGRGPGRPTTRIRNPKNWHGEPSIDYDAISLYQEAATGRASFFVQIPYLSVNPLVGGHASGFGDMNLGTKAVLFDTELLLVTFQFRTYLPVGNSTTGLGTGHVSLEPSILTTLRLATHTYLQGQLAEWIPIGGDPVYQGSVLESRLSLNHVLFNIAPGSPIIGTLEGSAWSFQSGAYTDPFFLKQPQRYSGNVTNFNFGPGLRASICDKIDFGGSITWPVGLTPGHFGDPWVRLEVRFLF